ncbi:uncharacterized protein [Eurosta solidaginis]|uniref:uncharacterized protein n=1 Tax=Eurosta solidaginis TaxID=178769 RepID=UPI003530D12E
MKSKRCKTEPQEAEDTASGISIALENGDNETAECNDAAENGELQSPQAQTRWTPECTRVMLQLRFERQVEFQQRIRQKKELWSEIAAEMRRQGLCDFSITAEVCDLKYRNMLQTYKKNRLKEDSGMHSLIAWEYYELFKIALTAAEEMEAGQEGNERVVPSLLCESVCVEGSEDQPGADVNETDTKLPATESVVDPVPRPVTEVDTEDVKSSANIKPIIANSRKRSRRSAMKTEATSPPPVFQLPTTKPIMQELPVPVENSKQESYTHTNQQNDTQPQMFNIKLDTSTRSERRRACSSFTAPTPIINFETPSAVIVDSQHDVTMNSLQKEPHTSSTSTSSMPIPTIMHMPPVQPQPQLSQSAVPAVSQTPITIVHPNHLQAIPIGLAPSEMRECQVFGESIGIQLAHVRETNVRAMVQFKIQELLYLAKTGKLLESVRM